MVEYGAVRLSLDLLKEVSDTISKTKLWINETDFVREAVREKISKVKSTQPRPQIIETIQPEA